MKVQGFRQLLLATLVISAGVKAQDIELAPLVFEEILVTGGTEAVRTTAGSASYIDETAIARFDQIDLNALLTQVPGVYIRTEDGYGLRPNIGIRGATTERSQKITLMEDGILIAPAPYSAPAAYYVPNVNRMSAVEVFKGPAAIHYGPHTVGGAVNMVSRTLPDSREGEVSLAYGSNQYHKARLVYGDAGEQWSFLLDGLRYGADGFKELDGGGDTGFERNDLNLKLGWRSHPGAAIPQTITLKLGYADETSDETYLGLTDDDFTENPLRRYRASALDQFDSEHSQAHLLHTARFNDNWQWSNKLYINRFDRAWHKLDGFFPETLAEGNNPYQGALSASTVLSRPEIFTRQMALLRGEVDSSERLADTLDITNNAREYGSQGIESEVGYAFHTGSWQHQLAVGVRYHHDFVDRDHQIYGYWMREGNLAFDGITDRAPKTDNRAETDALALYISDEIQRGSWKFNLGLRTERIEGEVANRLSDSRQTNTQEVIMPGAGVFYQLTPHLGLLAGINKGFSPSGPGAGEQIEPEESINVEYGLRYQQGALTVDAIGFISDYSNLLGRCRVSDAGCEPGEEFNGGSVEIAGLELTGGFQWALTEGIAMPLSLVYTYTETAFQTGFVSGFSQWGSVQQGDELPYTPEHQARLSAGLQSASWDIDVAVKYVGEMRDQPGRGTPEQPLQAHTLVDISGTWYLSSELSLKLVVENLTDEQEIVSRRPFGARPNAPRRAHLGVTYRF